MFNNNFFYLWEAFKIIKYFFVWPMIFIHMIMTGSLENLEDKNVNNDFSQVMFIYWIFSFLDKGYTR